MASEEAKNEVHVMIVKTEKPQTMKPKGNKRTTTGMENATICSCYYKLTYKAAQLHQEYRQTDRHSANSSSDSLSDSYLSL